jgi:hypothetical protein
MLVNEVPSAMMPVNEVHHHHHHYYGSDEEPKSKAAKKETPERCVELPAETGYGPSYKEPSPPPVYGWTKPTLPKGVKRNMTK